MSYMQKHLFYYFSLIIILSLELFVFFKVKNNWNLQVVILGSTVVSYMTWAMLHHYLEHDLSVKIVVEYILIGALGLSILLFAFKGMIGI